MDIKSGLYNNRNRLIYTWDELWDREMVITSSKNHKILCSTNIHIPNSTLVVDDEITELSNCVFDSNCMSKIILGKNVKAISTNAFDEFPSLKTIEVHPENTCISSQNGVLFSKDKKFLIRYPEGKTNGQYIVPDETNVIINSAFFKTHFLKLINLNNVEIVDEFSFQNSLSLENIYGGTKLKKIKRDAFANLSKLKEITLPKSLEKIEKGSFAENSCLVKYTGSKEDFTQIDGYLNISYLSNIYVGDIVYDYIPTLDEMIHVGKNIREINKILKNIEQIQEK